jgi:hypothetical protein
MPLSEEHLRKYIKMYLMASCIEIDTSAVELDFGLSLSNTGELEGQ